MTTQSRKTIQSWCYFRISDDCSIKIDIDDLEKVRLHKWFQHGCSREHLKIVTRIFVDGKRHQMTLARFLANCPENRVVCFWKSRNDFRKTNLLICSHSEKQHHYKKKKRKFENSSRFTGVSWDSDGQKWRATISCNNKSIYLGLFDSEDAAAACYQLHAERLFGIAQKKVA